jgi:hypothetical protein
VGGDNLQEKIQIIEHNFRESFWRSRIPRRSAHRKIAQNSMKRFFCETRLVLGLGEKNDGNKVLVSHHREFEKMGEKWKKALKIIALRIHRIH